MKSFAIVFAPLFCLFSCTLPSKTPSTTTPSVQQAQEDDLPTEWPGSPTLEKSWGPVRGPSLDVTGSQTISYRKTGTSDYVAVSYLGKNPRFTEIVDFKGKRATDGQLTVMGRRADFYFSGNEDPEITTQPMQLTSPDGETGWFSFSFSNKEHMKGKNIPTFTW